MSKASSDGPAASSFPCPRKVGWLFKQGGSGVTSHWRKRWFIVDHHYLFYYKGPNDKKPVGILCLPEYESCYKVDHSKEYKKPNTFLLDRGNSTEETDSPLKNYALYSDSGSEMQSWIDAIKEEMKPILGGGAPHPALNGGPSKKEAVKVDPKAFDEVSKLAVSEGPKLTHLTASRPKVKGRRPPKRYAVFHEDDSKEESPPSTPPPEQRKPSPSLSPSASPSSSPALNKKGHHPSVPLKPKSRAPSSPMLPPVEVPAKEAEPTISEAELPPLPSTPSMSPGVKRFNKPPPPRKPSASDAPKPPPPKKPVKSESIERETEVDDGSHSKPPATVPKKPKGPPTPLKPSNRAATSSSINTPSPTTVKSTRAGSVDATPEQPVEPVQPVQPVPRPRPRPTPRRRTKTPEPAKDMPIEKKQEEVKDTIAKVQPVVAIATEEVTPSKTVEEVDNKPAPPELPLKTEERESLLPKTDETEPPSVSGAKEAPTLQPPKTEEKELPPLPAKTDESPPQLTPLPEPSEEEEQLKQQQQSQTGSPKQDVTNDDYIYEPMTAGLPETADNNKEENPEATGKVDYDEVTFEGGEEPNTPKSMEGNEYDLVVFDEGVPQVQASPQRVIPDPLKIQVPKEKMEEGKEEEEEGGMAGDSIQMQANSLSPGSYVAMNPAGSILHQSLKSDDNEYIPMKEGVWMPEPTMMSLNPAHQGTPDTALQSTVEYQEVDDWTGAADVSSPTSPDYVSPNVDYDVPTLGIPRPLYSDQNGPTDTAAEKQDIDSTTATNVTASDAEKPSPRLSEKEGTNRPSSAISAGSGKSTSSKSDDVKAAEGVEGNGDVGPPPPIPPQDDSLYLRSFSSNTRHETIENDPFGYAIVKKDSKAGLIPDDRSASYSSQRTATSSSLSPAPPLLASRQQQPQPPEHNRDREGEQKEADSYLPDNVPNALRQAREILRLAKAVKAEAEEMKSEAQRELELARKEKGDAEVLKKNAAEILRMAKEKLNASGPRR